MISFTIQILASLTTYIEINGLEFWVVKRVGNQFRIVVVDIDVQASLTDRRGLPVNAQSSPMVPKE
jgi:hypothetical protein